jgi:hypothetical protein
MRVFLESELNDLEIELSQAILALSPLCLDAVAAIRWLRAVNTGANSGFRRWASRVCRQVASRAAYSDVALQACRACADALLICQDDIGREHSPPPVALDRNPRPDIGDRLDGDPTFTMAELDTIVEAAVLTERRAVVAWLREHAAGYRHAAKKGDPGARDVADELGAKANRIEKGEHRSG